MQRSPVRQCRVGYTQGGTGVYTQGVHRVVHRVVGRYTLPSLSPPYLPWCTASLLSHTQVYTLFLVIPGYSSLGQLLLGFKPVSHCFGAERRLEPR